MLRLTSSPRSVLAFRSRARVAALILGLVVASPAPTLRAQDIVPCGRTPAPLVLTNDWRNYGNGYAPATFYEDRAGRVHLQGLIRSGAWDAVIAVLPEGCRPANREIVSGNVHISSARVDVLPSGEVIYVSGRQQWDWLSLSGISFDSGDGGPAKTRRALHLTEGWEDLGSPFGHSYAYRRKGVVSVHGVLGASGSGVIGAMPRLQDAPVGRLIFTVMHGNLPARVDVRPDGDLVYMAGGGGSWLSLSGLSFPAANASLLPLELLSGWVPYGGEYADPSAYRDAAGRCYLQGLARSGPWDYIARVPPGCEPSGRLSFSANNNEAVTRLDVTSDGYVVYTGGSRNHGWVSLSGISYHPDR